MNAASPQGQRHFLRLYGLLVGWRLRFYAEATLKLLMRRWQWWVFTAFATSPATMPLAAQIHAAGFPVRRIVEGDSPGYALAVWPATMLVAAAWAAVQADALRGGMPWEYMRTLPALGRCAFAVDLGVLFVADLPLLIPFAAYFISAPATALDGLIACALAAQWLVIQQRLLRGSIAGLAIAASSLCAVLALQWEQGKEAALLMLSAGPAVAWLPWLQDGFAASVHMRRPWRVSGNRSPIVNMAVIHVTVLMQWRHLPARLAPGAYAVALGWFGVAWKGLGFQRQTAVALLLAGLLPLVFQSSGLAVTLRAARKPLLPWLSSLGVSPRTLLAADFLVMEAAFALIALGPVCLLQVTAQTWMASLLLPAGGLAVASLALSHGAGSGGFLARLIVGLAFLAVGWGVLRF